jgi:hypothetical protein
MPTDPTPEQPYTRLTRTRARAFGVVYAARSSLWLGADHLLLVASNGYSETYQRFYFRDIQVLWIRRTDNWKYWGLAWGVLAGLFALFSLVTADVAIGYRLIFFGGPAFVFVALLLLNLAAGPSCICHLRTAVQTVELSALNRVPRARRAFDHLRPLIAGAQGELAPEQIHAQLEPVSTVAAAGEEGALVSTPTPAAQPENPQASPPDA